jgi:hypothetical protein
MHGFLCCLLATLAILPHVSTAFNQKPSSNAVSAVDSPHIALILAVRRRCAYQVRVSLNGVLSTLDA